MLFVLLAHSSMFDHYLLNRSYSRPEAYYFWCYFVLMNAFWIVIPLYLVYSGVNKTWRAFDALNKAERLLKKGTNGSANGRANGTPKKKH